MKQLKKVKKSKLIAIIITALVLIAGLVITLTVGFNVELENREHKQLQLYINKVFDEKDIKKITDEVLAGQEVIIQKVELYDDTVLISSDDITDEQKTNLVTKINEKYETELSADEQTVETVPKVRIRDILKQYVTSFIVTTVIILIYFAIKYKRLKSIKIILKTLFTLIVAEGLLFAVMAITRIPIGKLTASLVIIVYLLTVTILTNKYENKVQEIKSEEEKDKKKNK